MLRGRELRGERRDERRGDGRLQYQLRERMFSIGDDYWIETNSGERVYKVDGKALPGQDDALILAVAVRLDRMSPD